MRTILIHPELQASFSHHEFVEMENYGTPTGIWSCADIECGFHFMHQTIDYEDVRAVKAWSDCPTPIPAVRQVLYKIKTSRDFTRLPHLSPMQRSRQTTNSIDDNWRPKPHLSVLGLEL